MNLVVLDSSVAAKWLVWAGEPLETQALELLARRNRRELEFLVPDLFWPEMGNFLWKASHRGRCTPAQAKHSLDALRHYGLATAPSQPFLEEAFAIALQYERSFYDSLYVTLAVSRQATFITADEKFARATAAYLPVKWLGAIE